jgi:hypothetical protein
MVDPSVAYVSLPPGAIPNGISATIHDEHTGSSVTAGMVNGGFDPVALSAVQGDSWTEPVSTVAESSGSLKTITTMELR